MVVSVHQRRFSVTGQCVGDHTARIALDEVADVVKRLECDREAAESAVRACPAIFRCSACARGAPVLTSSFRRSRM